MNRLAKGRIILWAKYTAVSELLCGNKFTMMNSVGLKMTVSIDFVNFIVRPSLHGNSSSIVIHDPVGRLIHMI
jgi:hypothetical protein